MGSVVISARKECSVRLYLRLFVGGRIFSLLCLCFLACCGVQHILYCVFAVFLCLVYRMLSVSLDSSLLIAPSVFYNIYTCQ